MKFTFRLTLIWLLCHILIVSYSQQATEQGVIRVKFKNSYARSINGNLLPYGQFGFKDTDDAAKKIGVKSATRIFRESGKFEKAHRAFGLHLWYEITFDKSVAVSTALNAYNKLPEFEIVEDKKVIHAISPMEERVVPPSVQTISGTTNDPQFNLQWHYENSGQSGGTPGADVSLPQAWAVQTGSPDVIVAVIDGGIDVSHPDLTGSMWINEDEIAGNSIDDDANGYVDDIYGYGFGDNTGTIYPHFHGTHVGGTIAAITNNGVGVSGIAGGSGTANGVRLMSCAGFGQFGTGGFEAAMVYAADNGAVISQNSWGGGSQAIEDAIDYFIARAGFDNSDENFDDNLQIGPMAGGLVIFAAGNSNTNIPSIGYPASYAPVMAVASTDHNDVKSYFSNYGSWVDIAAPGSNVYSTYPVSLGSYAYLSGTSMACPHVSGVAALIISEFKSVGLSPNQVWDRLQGTADNIDTENPSFVDLLGAGRVNAYQSLQIEDEVPPATITNLAVTMPLLTSLKISWTAPGASAMDGAASAYEIRYSTTLITEANFPSATLVTNPPRPQGAGTPETFEIKNLLSNSTYYVAIKARDFFGNVSSLSNVVSSTTLQPPVINVSPSSLSANLFAGESVTKNLTVTNNGLSDLYIVSKTQQVILSTSALARSRTITEQPKLKPKSVREAYTQKLVARDFQVQSKISVAPQPASGEGRLFALNHSSGTIQEYDTETGAVVKSISPPEPFSGGPDGLAFDGIYLYYISGWGSNDIHRIDASTGALVSTLSLGSIPSIDGLAHSGKFVYALDYSNGVMYEIDFDEGEFVRTIDPGVNIGGGITFGGSRGTIFVSDFGSAIYEVELESGEVIHTLPVPGTIYGLGYSEALGLLFVANVSSGTADAINPDTGTKLFSLPGINSAAMATDEAGNNWFRIPDDAPTVVSVGESVIIPVIIDADGLTGGAYNGRVVIESNDPVTPTVQVPVALTVTGAPNLLVTPSIIEFEDAFLNGTSSITVVIKNNGTDLLTITSITVADDIFAVADGELSLAAGETYSAEVTFTPTVIGDFESALVIESNDPDQPEFSVPITASCVLPPDISVSPTEIISNLFINEIETYDLVISNIGAAPLQWSLSAGETTTTSAWVPAITTQAETTYNNTSESVSSSVIGGPFQLAEGDFSARANSPSHITCVAVNPATGKIYAQQNQGAGFYVFDPNANSWSSLAPSPLSSGNNGGAVFLNGKIYTIYTENSSTMGVYDVASNSWTTISNSLLAGTANITTDGVSVFVLVNSTFKKYNPADNTWTGLASPPFAFQPWGGLAFNGGKIYGHQGNGYSGFAKYEIATNSWTQLTNVPGGAVLGAAIDPIAKKYYTYGSYLGTNWYSYDFTVNEWEVNTIPLFNIHDGGMAYVGKGGVNGIYFTQGEAGLGFARFESESSWMAHDISSGTIEPGSVQTVHVTINSTGLLGGTYGSHLTLISNDPDEEEIEIPVTLNVTGASDIIVSASELDFGDVFVGDSKSKTITISNIGTDNLEVTEIEISGDDGFSTTELPFTLEPGDAKELSFVFSPATDGEAAATITLTTNDPDETIIVIALSGESDLPPIIQVDPTSIEADLLSGETTTRIINIHNAGASDLDWTISLGNEVVASTGLFSQAQDVIGTNNSGVSVSSEVIGEVPLGPGDFTVKASSSVPLTCVTVDPTTGYLYAQANGGTAFFRYSPLTNTWTSLAEAPLYSGNNGGATYLNGKIYTIYTSNSSSIGVYNIASNTWSIISNGLGVGTGNITTDGTDLYAAVGYSFKKYNVTLNQWTSLSNTPFDYTPWGGLKFLDGYIYGHSGNSTTGFARYNVATNSWSTLASVPGGAVLGSTVDPSAKKYYAYGSYGGSNWYTYDIVTNAWSVSTIPLFSINDGGMAFIKEGAERAVYFVQGETGTGFGSLEVANTSGWLSALVDAGTIAPGESQEVEITIDTDGMLGGEYEGAVTIDSNDPETSSLVVPVSLTVTGTGDIHVHQTNINFGVLRVERNADTAISIQNTGTSNLFVSEFTSSHEAFSAFFSPFILSPGEGRLVYVRFLPMTAGNFSGVFTIVSDDTDEPEIEVAFTGVGLSAPDLQLSKEALNFSVTSGQSTSTTISLDNLGQSELIWYRSVSGQSVSLASQTFTVEDKHESPYVVNNANEKINTKLPQSIYPLAPGDFTIKAPSPSAMTCVTADPATGFIYAQVKYGYGFYRYDPNTNQWSLLNNSPLYSYANGGAVVLNNKVYTVYVDNSSSIGVYDIATGVWTTMSNGLFTGTMNITTDGQKLFLIAGSAFKSYDPITNLWTALLTPPFTFSKWGGIAYKDGMIYGHQGDGSTAAAQYYLRDGHWENLPSIPGGAIGGVAIDLQSNKYYAYGNYYGNSLYALDLDTRVWSLTSIPFFNVHNGGLAFVNKNNVSGIYITQGELGSGLSRFETLPLQRWLAATPANGTIAGNNSNAVTVSIDATRMRGGTYSGTITFVTNEGANGVTHRVPINLTVASAPSIAIESSAIAYGSTYINSRKDSIVIVRNNGSEVLNITSIVSSRPEFKVSQAVASILPGGEYTLNISYSPTSLGIHSASITINSNDPINPAMTVDVQGIGIASRFAVAPNAFKINLAPGNSETHSFNIRNTFAESTQWNVSVAGNANNDLQSIRQSLSTSFGVITDLIPNKYLFSEGETGYYISDGGGDMYDGGNYLNTNLSSGIQYTNGVIQNTEAFGPASRYFTVKHPGLFAMVADCSIQRFTIDGNLGADGSGSYDGAVLTSVRGGRVFKGFVKRVYNAGDPSVNHLIIVENNGSVSHQFSSDTNSDFHQVDNLNGVNRIYYLLFASNGSYINNTSMEAIMNAFINLSVGTTAWLTVGTTSGSLSANQTFVNALTVSGVNLPVGKYMTNFNVASNHGGEPFVVPVELNVGTFAEMEMSTTQINFEEIYTNAQNNRNFVIRNNGTTPLIISSVISSNAAFTASLSRSNILPGDSAIVTVTALVQSPGSHDAVLTIVSNDASKPESIVELSAIGKNPPLASLSTSTTSFEIFKGESVNVPLKLKNIGGSAMNWSLAALPSWIRSSSASGALNPDEETVFTVTINTKELSSASHLITVTVNYNHPTSTSISIPLAVTVKLNHPPVATAAIPSQTLRIGTTSSLDLKLFFNDADAHVLTYSATHSFQNLLSTTVQGSMLAMVPKDIGEGYIFIKAKDTAGDSITTGFIFKIMPANNAPEIVKTINDLTLHTGDKSTSLNLAEYFVDKDITDQLTFGVLTGQQSVVNFSMVGSVLSIAPKNTGTTVFTVWAQDNSGARVQMDGKVEVKTITGIERSSRPHIVVYPNPFTRSTRFEYTLNTSSAVELTVFDVTGRPLVRLVDAIQIGVQTYELDGGSLTSGVYFYHFKVNGKVLVIQKLIKQ